MEQIDWESFKSDLVKSLKEKKDKYPFLNRRMREEHASEIIENFKNGEWQFSPQYIESLINQLKDDIEIAPPREKKNLEFYIDLLEVTREVIDNLMKSRKKMEEKIEIEEDELKIKVSKVKEKYSGIIGRISLSQHTPATPSTFFFWVRNDVNLHIEPGGIITVEGEVGGGEAIKIVGIIEDVKAMSDVPSSISEFYSTGYGNPEEEVSVERPVIREAKARVIKRTDERVEPIVKKWPVYFASHEDIIDAYAGHIQNKNRILVGFTYDERKQPVPIFADFEYIFGYKGAHFNIAGCSGLAAKTSYALFLILSTLSYAKQHHTGNIGIIAFNVKEQDLLKITKFKEKFHNWEEIIEKLENHSAPQIRKSAELWREAKNNNIDPFEILEDEEIKILEPDRDYKFGFADIVELGENTPDIFKMMFDPQDIDDNFEALLSGIIEDYRNESFAGIKDKIKQKIQRSSSQSGGQGRPSRRYSATDVYIGGIPIHSATIAKFLRRYEVALSQLRKILEERTPRIGTTKRIPIHKLRSGQIFIVNIEPLPDRGKRLVFLSTLKMVNKILEAKRERKETVELWCEDVDISSFPERVAIFVDELNKFAPRGREFSPIKYPIIDIAARGRSLGLSLIGAEQMASQVDGEVLANCSTFAVGRVHPVEIRDKSYDWIKGDLKERVTILKPGEIIMFHALHNAPVLLNFPIPLHHLIEGA